MKLLTHLGLGDHLITFGLVKELEKRYGVVELFCKEHNFESLRSIYSNSSVLPWVISDETHAFKLMSDDPFNSLKIGFISTAETEEEFGNTFYRQAAVDISSRYKYPIGKSEKQAIAIRPGEIFIHDTAQFPISIKGYRPSFDIAADITEYCNIIENAEEVHVIESSFRQLIEFLNPKGKLFLHRFEEKSFRVVSSRHKWTII